MKYLTKEWYELCQKTSYHLLLEEDQQAETCSEEFFQQLKNSELNSWLELQEEVNSLMKEQAESESNIEYEPFDRERVTEQFHQGFIINQEELKRDLPEDILNQIADIRVFALNKATRPVIDAVTKFCEENEKAVEATMEEYRTYFEKASASFDKEIVENFGFHDCIIEETVEKNPSSLKLVLNNSGGFTDIKEVTFENFEIIKQDGTLEDSWWLYEEVYKVNDKYEFHALLTNKEMGLIDFIISADKVSFKR